VKAHNNNGRILNTNHLRKSVRVYVASKDKKTKRYQDMRGAHDEAEENGQKA